MGAGAGAGASRKAEVADPAETIHWPWHDDLTYLGTWTLPSIDYLRYTAILYTTTVKD